MTVTYVVPYEGGFNSGEHTFNNLNDAIAASKTAYGDVFYRLECQLVKDGKPTEYLIPIGGDT